MRNAITNTQLAVIDFWGQYGIPVYEQGQANVMVSGRLEPAPFPYITYSFSIGEYGANDISTAQVWTRSTGNAQLFEILEKISEAIPVAQWTRIPVRNGQGMITVRRSAPFIQPYAQEDPMFRVRLVSLEVVSYVM